MPRLAKTKDHKIWIPLVGTWLLIAWYIEFGCFFLRIGTYK